MPRGEGAPPTLVDRVCPLALILSPVFFIFSKSYLRGFSGHSENFCFLHKNNTMAVLLKTASVRVSFIQIMQVRVQNKGKSVWKSRYVGDVSPTQKRVISVVRAAMDFGFSWPRCRASHLSWMLCLKGARVSSSVQSTIWFFLVRNLVQNFLAD